MIYNKNIKMGFLYFAECMKKTVIALVLFLTLLTFIFFNLGKWVDVTEKPVSADIVICLGGGTVERVKKSIALLEQGYANKFLLLGESWYNQPYIKKNYPELSVLIDEHPKNTQEEVLFITKYMKKHGYHNALIVTDPPHTRRVKVLAAQYLNDNDKISFRMIASDVTWWNREHYYQNEWARNAAWHELMKDLYILLIGYNTAK